ncbi:MAG: class I SAM-dependent methyltransferase [Pseudomonadota bacterium]
MSDSSRFVGDIPTHYDQGLGPVIFQQYAKDLAERAAKVTPANVLEMAAGTGILTRHLRDLLPAEAALTATDLNAPRLECARAKFGEAEKVQFRTADAMQLDFADDTFDLVVCQFGVMFFPDKIASYREALRVLKPGGTYLFNVWGSLEDNPFARITDSLAAELFPEDPPQFYKVPFHYHDVDQVRADLEAAGITAHDATTVTFVQTIDDPAAFSHGLVFGNPFVAEIEAKDNHTAEEIRVMIEARLHDAFGPAPLKMPLKATVLAARRV